MDNGGEGKVAEIRNLIGEYLSNQPKRKIDETIEIDDATLMIGKYVTAEIIRSIWNSYKCKDINEYLFSIDLASFKELLDFYKVISKRIAILYQQDKKLEIKTRSGGYLARANYDLLVSGYQEGLGRVLGRDKCAFNIDLASLTFIESHEIGGIYMWNEDSDIKATSYQIGNDNIKKLVKTLDKNIQNMC